MCLFNFSSNETFKKTENGTTLGHADVCELLDIFHIENKA